LSLRSFFRGYPTKSNLEGHSDAVASAWQC
jgi:hypothetical protein